MPHIENCSLGALNYQHSGSDKVWLSISRNDASKYRKVVKAAVRENLPARACPRLFMDHKWLNVTPRFILDSGIDIDVIIQQAKDCVYVGPNVYHWGVNFGNSINEAINITNHDWFHQKSHMFDYCRCKLSNSVAIRPDELINGVYHARSVAPSARKGKPGFALSATSKPSYNQLKQGYAHR